MVIGFVGGSFGLTPEQLKSIRDTLLHFKPEEVYHPCSSTSDHHFHYLVADCLKNTKINIKNENYHQLVDFLVLAPDTKRKNANVNIFLAEKKVKNLNKKVLTVYPDGSTNV